ncbi:MAG: ABC transporter ATP-binding protein [Halanaerobiales bacterium]
MEVYSISREIIVDSLSYKYDSSQETNLENINLEVKKGEIIGVLGVTGAGKTTLMRTLNGLIPQFFEGDISGRVEVKGLDTQVYQIQSLIRKVGFVFDDPETQIFGTNVREDVAFGPANYGLPRQEIVKKIKDALYMVGLDGYEDRSTAKLSGGEKQRVAIAGVFAMGPDILILDEPTAALDPVGKSKIFEIIRELQAKGITILLVEHETEEVARIADRIIVLNEGQLVKEGSTREIFADIPFLREQKLRIPEMAGLGWQLFRQGLIDRAEIPLTVDEGENLLRDRLRSDGEVSYNIKDEVLTPGLFPVIEVENLFFSYEDDLDVLKNINLSINSGEFMALVGQNGAGKTTFSKTLNKLLTPRQGTIKVNGYDTANMETADLADTVGYVFQNPDQQIFSSTIKEEIEYGLKNMGVPEDERMSRIDKVLSAVELDKPLDTNPFNLGKGERQRLAVASILALEPELLIIDEPTTGQDWQGTLNMMNLIKSLNKKGHTILIITHNMRIVADYCQRVVVLSQGEIIADSSPRDIFARPELLKKAKLRPPQISRLALRLSDMGIPREIININEMLSVLGQLI